MSINERIIRHGPSGKPATDFFDIEANLLAGSADTLFTYQLPENSSVDVSVKLEARAGAKRTSWRWYSVYENLNGLVLEQSDFRNETLDEDDVSWAPTVALSGSQLLVTMNADALAATGVRARVFLLEEFWASEPLVLIGPLPTLYNLDTNTITGRGTPGLTVVVTVGGLAFGSAVVDENGDWSVSALLSLPAIGSTTVVATMGALSDSKSATVAWPIDTTGLIAWLDARVGVDVFIPSVPSALDAGWIAGSKVSILDSTTVLSTDSGVQSGRFIYYAPNTVPGPCSITIHFSPTEMDPGITHVRIETDATANRAWISMATGAVTNLSGTMTGVAIPDGNGGWIATFSWTVLTAGAIVYIACASAAGSTSSNCPSGVVALKILGVSLSQFTRVTSWSSQLPLGPVFSQATASLQPSFTDAPTFDGVDDILDAGATLDEKLFNSAGTIIFRVNKTDSNIGTLFTTANGSFNATFLTGIYFGQGGAGLFFAITAATGTAAYQLQGAASWLGEQLVGARWDGATATLHRYGDAPVTGAIASTLPAGAHNGNPVIADPTTGFGGKVDAALFYNRKLTEAEYDAAVAYLIEQFPL